MALSKLAIGLIASVLTVGAIGGITAGIVTSQNRSGDLNIEGNEGDETNEMGNKNPNPSDTSKPEMINLQAILDGITQNNIVYSPKAAMESVSKKASTPSHNQQDQRSNAYAFDVKAEELSLDEKTQNKIPQGVKVTIELANNTNQALLLNNGKLPIVVKAKLNNQESETKEKPLQVTGFKQTSEVLKKAFATVAQEGDNKAVLDLSKPEKSTEITTLTTIEELNKKTPLSKPKATIPGVTTQTTQQVNAISGLTALFQKIKTPMNGDNPYATVVIEGTVKLTKISKSNKDTHETLFHLSSSTNSPLKLINNKAQETSEVALVDEIVVTNLLASNIKLVPTEFDDKDQMPLLEEFKKDATSKGYEVAGDSGYTINAKSGGPKISVNPLLIKRTEKTQPITVNLEISFGTNDQIKTYKTSEKDSLDELINAGFGFAIYSKKLDGVNDKVPMAMKITDGNMLETYFVANGSKVPVMKSTLVADMMKIKGGFSLVPEDKKPLTSNIEIGKATNSMEEELEEADTGHEKWLPENWISFVGYTFKGVGQNSIDEKSLLFIPTINLIHIQEPTPATGTGIGA